MGGPTHLHAASVFVPRVMAGWVYDCESSQESIPLPPAHQPHLGLSLPGAAMKDIDEKEDGRHWPLAPEGSVREASCHLSVKVTDSGDTRYLEPERGREKEGYKRLSGVQAGAFFCLQPLDASLGSYRRLCWEPSGQTALNSAAPCGHISRFSLLELEHGQP